MLCVRCSHPLPPGADRCVRCFALNPQNRAAAPKAVPTPPELRPPGEPSFLESPNSDPAIPRLRLPSGPAARFSVESDPPPPSRASIESDPPPPLEASIDSGPPPERSGDDPVFTLAPPSNTPAPPPLAARETRPFEELGDVELGNLDLTGPMPVLPEDSGTTLHFGDPVAPIRAAASPVEQPAASVWPEPKAASASPEPPAASEDVTEPPEVPLEAAWRSRSMPPAGPQPEGPSRLETPFAPPDRGPEASSLLSMTLDEEPPAALLPRKVHKPPTERTPWARVGPRLLAWSADLVILTACAALQILVAAEVIGPQRLAPPGFGSADYWLDLLSGPRLPALWGCLFALLAVGYSWLFAAVGGRTPGMMLANLRLRRLDGDRVSPAAALARAALGVVSAPALIGFAFALFDARGQALHDKLTGTALVTDGPAAF